MTISLEEILAVLGEEAVLLGNRNISISHLKPVDEADNSSLVWLGAQPQDTGLFIQNSPAGAFILPLPVPHRLQVPENKSVIFVNDSRLAAITILSRFFRQRPDWGTHPTAVVHDEAQVHPETYVGPHTYVGKCTLGRGSILYGNNYLYDGVRVGENVTVHAGSVIGSDGFGYQPGQNKDWLKFEHVGGVSIGSGVEIGANTCIDRGALGDTVIGAGTKIDNLVHIAHNVQIGRHCLVIAHAMIGGSCVIGDGAWIAPNASILQKTRIGPGSTVGVGAVVLEDVPPNEIWAGVPARRIDQKNKKPEQHT
jgi:UDP-3-O-[3-hydroxymyristoyl] glucosamine N-acyltransferase